MSVIATIARALGYLCLVSGLALVAWVAACETTARAAQRRARRNGPALRPAHPRPHPLGHPAVHVDAPDDASAWAAIDARCA